MNARLAEPLNYARFFVDQLLPADAETAIYLDSDVTVRASLVDLDAVARRKFAANTSALVAVVPREYKNVCRGFVNCRHPAIRRVFPRPEAELHAFNAGVVVFHVRRWAAQHVRDKAKAWILENAKTAERQHRVYTLGSNPPFMLVVGRRWAALDHRWNCMRGLRRQRLHNTRCWADAYVRHFPGGRKPWELAAGDRRALGYDFVVPPACAALNASTFAAMKSDAGRGERRAARAANAARRRKRPSGAPKADRVPKWVHVVGER